MFLGEIDLENVSVRPILSNEVPVWEELMNSYHYLKCPSAIGKSVRYVALYEGEIVGLLSWSYASLKNACRDRWIGWDAFLREKRLRYVANNTRFLILPWIQKKNLASRVTVVKKVV
jgi:hypothetical protein